MKPVEEKELIEIRTDFVKFLQLNNTELKSAYLAVSGRGFTNLLQSSRDAVLLEREHDHNFVVCSYPLKPEPEKATEKSIERIIRFHTDSTIFE